MTLALKDFDQLPPNEISTATEYLKFHEELRKGFIYIIICL